MFLGFFFFQNKKLVPLQGLGSANKPNPNIAIQQTVIQNTGVIISILAQKYYVGKQYMIDLIRD